MGSLNLLGLSLTFELYFAQIILKTFDLELYFVVLSLENPPYISLLFNISGILHKKLILINL